METIINTAYLSLIVQLITGLLGFYAIFLPLNENDRILKDVLILETIVQFVEFVFYLFLIYNFTTIKKNITHFRYYDWIITTPIMLVSTAFYFIYNSNRQLNNNKVVQMAHTLMDEYLIFSKMIIYNFLMLLFGYLGELKYISQMFSLVTGSIFFVLAFKELHFFVKDNQINKIIFYIMFSIWSLYGVAFLLSYENKNSLYNILDLLSKNFYGLFLFGLIYYLSKKKDNKNI